MSEIEEKNSAPKKKKRSRFLRILLYLAVGFVLLIVVLYVALRIFIATGKLEAVLYKAVQDNLHRSLSIESIRIKPLRGFELNNVIIAPISRDSAFAPDAFPVRYASVEKVLLKYRLRALWHKQIKINEILVERPQVELFLTPPPADTTTGRIAAAKVPEKDSLQTAESVTSFPVSFELDLLQFRDAKINIVTVDSNVTQKIYLGDLDFYVDDLQIPRGELLAQTELLKGNIHLGCEKTRFSFFQKTTLATATDSLSVSGILNLDTNLILKGLDSLTTNMTLGLRKLKFATSALPELSPLSFPFSLSFNAGSQFNYTEQKLVVDPLAIKIGGNTWLNLRATVDSVLTRPSIRLAVQQGKVPFRQLVKIASTVLPDSLLRPIYLLNEQSFLSLAGTSVSGKLAGDGEEMLLQLKGVLSVKDFGLTYNYGQFELSGFHFSATSKGVLSGDKISGLQAAISAGYDTLSANLTDSMAVYTGRADLHTAVTLNERFLPLSVKGAISIENILGADLSCEYDIASPTNSGELQGGGYFQLTKIGLDRLPASPVRSTAQMVMTFFVNTLDSIATNLTLDTDSLRLQLDEQKEVFPPLHLVADMVVRTDTSFENFELRKFNLALNDLLTASVQGQVRALGQKGFSFSADTIRLNHHPVLDWLPRQVQYSLEDLAVTGYTILQADVKGTVLPEDSVQYDLSARFHNEQTNILYPSQFLTVGGLQYQALAHINSDSGGDVRFSIKVDSFRTEQLPQPLTLKNNALSLQVVFKDFDSFDVLDGRLSLPDLHGEGKFNARLSQLATNPTTRAHFELDQIIGDTLRLTPDIHLLGTTHFGVDLTLDTLFADVSIDLKINDLTLVVPNLSEISDINADLRVHQKVDLVRQVILGAETSEIYTPTEASIDYYTYRPYYLKAIPNLSHLSIRKIQVLDYTLENFQAELLLGDGYVEIPTFLVDLYDGNMGGRLSVDLAGGDLARASYKLTGHFSGINSSLLLPRGADKGKKSIINANMKLFGRGLDPEQGLDVGGYFYVTDIGPKVLANLLNALQARRSDSGIGYTQKLLSWGFKPKVVSFEIKNGYFYPAIFFAQPWYFPAHLSGGRVELARIPIMFFVQTAMQSQAASAE